MSSNYLAEALAKAEREPAAEQLAEHDQYRLPGAAVAEEIRRAVTAELHSRADQRGMAREREGKRRGRVKVSEHERDALCQLVALRLVGNRWRGRPREVLAYIDRAERMPTIVARERELAEQRRTGRTHIRMIVRTLLRESRAWRDLAGSYQTQAQTRDDTGPMILPLVVDGEGEPVGALAREQSCSLPLDAARPELAESMAAELAAELRLKPHEQRAAAVALLAGLPNPEDGEPRRGPQLAAELGLTYDRVRKDLRAGRELWARRFPDPAELARRCRETAERLGLMVAPDALAAIVAGRPAPIHPADKRKRSAVEGAQAREREQLEGYQAGARSGSPELWRAARRNLRALSGRPVLRHAPTHAEQSQAARSDSARRESQAAEQRKRREQRRTRESQAKRQPTAEQRRRAEREQLAAAWARLVAGEPDEWRALIAPRIAARQAVRELDRHLR